MISLIKRQVLIGQLFSRPQQKPAELLDLESRIRVLEMKFQDIDGDLYPLHKYFTEKELGEAYNELMNMTIKSAHYKMGGV